MLWFGSENSQEEARRYLSEALPLYRRVGDLQGEANCIFSLGEIALANSNFEEAGDYLSEALSLYRKVGSRIGEANCLRNLGDIALENELEEAARQNFISALELYSMIPEPYSIGLTHFRLAAIAPNSHICRQHKEAAKAAWESIGFTRLLSQLDNLC